MKVRRRRLRTIISIGDYREGLETAPQLGPGFRDRGVERCKSKYKTDNPKLTLSLREAVKRKHKHKHKNKNEDAKGGSGLADGLVVEWQN